MKKYVKCSQLASRARDIDHFCFCTQATVSKDQLLLRLCGLRAGGLTLPSTLHPPCYNMGALQWRWISHLTSPYSLLAVHSLAIRVQSPSFSLELMNVASHSLRIEQKSQCLREAVDPPSPSCRASFSACSLSFFISRKLALLSSWHLLCFLWQTTPSTVIFIN